MQYRSATINRGPDLGRYSLARTMQALSNGEPLSGLEAEVQEVFGGDHTPGYRFGCNATLPWGVLAAGQRDLNVATPSAGGNLVGWNVGPAADVLRPYSVATRAGMTVLSELKGDVGIPSVLDEIEFQWLIDESSTGPSLTPTTGLATLRPHTASGLISYPGRLVRGAAPGLIEQFVRRRLMLAVGQLIDTVVLQGGSNRGTTTVDDMGEPLGLCNTPGVMSYSGDTSAGLFLVDAVRPAMTYAAYKLGSDDGASWIGGPSVRSILLTHWEENFSVDGAGRLYNKPFHCTSGMAGNALAYGDWRNAVLGLFGPGIDIAIDPFTGFKSDTITMRCMVTMDVAFPNPAAFAIANAT